MGLSEDLFHKTVSISSTEFNDRIKLLIKDFLAVSQKPEIYVFGSVARNTATNNSDLDILIVIPENEDYKKVQSHFYQLKTKNHPL